MKPIPRPWSENEDQRALQLWCDGHSAAQIARTLGGRTRNAVIGRLNRIGAAKRVSPDQDGHVAMMARAAARRRRVLRVKQAPIVFAPPPVAETVAAPPLPLVQTSVAQFTRFTCRYPYGDPQEADFTFCGRTCASGPYCADHTRLCYQPVAKRQPDRLALWLAGRTMKAAGAA